MLSALAATTAAHIGGVGAVLEVVSAGCRQRGLELVEPLLVGLGERGISPREGHRRTIGGVTLNTAAAWRTEVTRSASLITGTSRFSFQRVHQLAA
jgi:hypothetical protein